jgi:phage virion morphogenesis protein
MSAVQGIEAVLNRFAQMQKAANNMQKPLKASAVYMFGSIERNFKAQGRPTKWQKLSKKTLARRRKGQDNEGGKKKPQILIDTGRLKNSVTSNADVTSGGFTIGTNVIYARRQHFGYPGGKGRGRSKTPARPFLMFQQEDGDAILKIFNRHFGIK